ncbi:hypothetical protein GCM10027160_38820 [Streptomyces calidiresistens]
MELVWLVWGFHAVIAAGLAREERQGDPGLRHEPGMGWSDAFLSPYVLVVCTALSLYFLFSPAFLPVVIREDADLRPSGLPARLRYLVRELVLVGAMVALAALAAGYPPGAAFEEFITAYQAWVFLGVLVTYCLFSPWLLSSGWGSEGDDEDD